MDSSNTSRFSKGSVLSPKDEILNESLEERMLVDSHADQQDLRATGIDTWARPMGQKFESIENPENASAEIPDDAIVVPRGQKRNNTARGFSSQREEWTARNLHTDFDRSSSQLLSDIPFETSSANNFEPDDPTRDELIDLKDKFRTKEDANIQYRLPRVKARTFGPKPIADDSASSSFSSLVKECDKPMQEVYREQVPNRTEAGDQRTTPSILDDISRSASPQGYWGNVSDSGNNRKLDIDLWEKLPYALVNNDFIYYDNSEKCLIARNLQTDTTRKIQLCLLQDKENHSGKQLRRRQTTLQARLNQIDAINVQFITHYGKWVIITSRYGLSQQRADTVATPTPYKGYSQREGTYLVQYYNIYTDKCEREFRIFDWIIQQQCTNKLLVLMLATREVCEYIVNVCSERDKLGKPLHSIRLITSIAKPENIRMLLSNNMNISVYDMCAQSTKSYVFNLAKVGNLVDLQDNEIRRKNSVKPLNQSTAAGTFNANDFVISDLNEHEIREIKQAFDLFDADGSGRMDPTELKYALRAFGIDVDAEIADQMFKSSDVNGNGVLEFEEFLAIIHTQGRAMEYTTGYRQLALISPNYILSGRPSGNQYEICLREIISNQKVYEHTFDLRLQCTRVSKNSK